MRVLSIHRRRMAVIERLMREAPVWQWPTCFVREALREIAR